MTAETTVFTAPFWRSRRAAAIAGILFGLLLLTVIGLMQSAFSDSSYQSIADDEHRRRLIRVSLSLIPFAGIAFLWFIGVIREHLGEREDRLFSTVFLGSGLLFLGLLFEGAVTLSSMLDMLGGTHANPDVWAYGRDQTRELFSGYAMRMAAVFTISVSTVSRRSSALPRWISYLGYLVALLLLFTPGKQTVSQALFPAWVLLVSTAILLTRPHLPEADSD